MLGFSTGTVLCRLVLASAATPCTNRNTNRKGTKIIHGVNDAPILGSTAQRPRYAELINEKTAHLPSCVLQC